MKRKMLYIICIIISIMVGIMIFKFFENRETINQNTNIVENKIELSSKYVTDDCTNEWNDYRLTIQEEIQETSQNISEENKHYILKSRDDLVCVYYINEKNEEVLYKVTEISTKYLADEDVKELEIGINVYGIQELNKLLEDFE